MNRIREALANKRAIPIFIETLARRLSVVAPVEQITCQEDDSAIADGNTEDRPQSSAGYNRGSLISSSAGGFAGRASLRGFRHIRLRTDVPGLFCGSAEYLAEIRELTRGAAHANQIFTVLISDRGGTEFPVRTFLLLPCFSVRRGCGEKFLSFGDCPAGSFLWALSPFCCCITSTTGLALPAMTPAGLLSVRSTVRHPHGARHRGAESIGRRPITPDSRLSYIRRYVLNNIRRLRHPNYVYVQRKQSRL